MSNLRKQIIKLAYDKPELREHLLPVLKTAASFANSPYVAKELKSRMGPLKKRIRKWVPKHLRKTYFESFDLKLDGLDVLVTFRISHMYPEFKKDADDALASNLLKAMGYENYKAGKSNPAVVSIRSDGEHDRLITVSLLKGRPVDYYDTNIPGPWAIAVTNVVEDATKKMMEDKFSGEWTADHDRLTDTFMVYSLNTSDADAALAHIKSLSEFKIVKVRVHTEDELTVICKLDMPI